MQGAAAGAAAQGRGSARPPSAQGGGEAGVSQLRLEAEPIRINFPPGSLFSSTPAWRGTPRRQPPELGGEPQRLAKGDPEGVGKLLSLRGPLFFSFSSFLRLREMRFCSGFPRFFSWSGTGAAGWLSRERGVVADSLGEREMQTSKATG